VAIPSAGSVLLILDVAYWREPGTLLASGGGAAGDGDHEERDDEHRAIVGHVSRIMTLLPGRISRIGSITIGVR